MIQLHNVTKVYEQLEAVRDVSLHVQEGDILGLVGPSGAGKSTLLRMMNLLEQPTAGDVYVDGQCLTKASNAALREARKNIGMIFQHFHLLSNKTAYENVAVALELANYPVGKRAARIEQCLAFVGLETMAHKYPAQLSGGQKQRVAIARALANNPRILLCDEPTSALDPTTTAEILGVLQNIHATFGVTIVVVSHELDVIKRICTRVCVMADGALYKTLTIEPTGVRQLETHPQAFVDALLKEGH